MAQRVTKHSILLRLYQRYLNDADTAQFITAIAGRYSLGTLHRLVVSGDVYSRRASALALGLLGDMDSVSVMGPLLRSGDRKLRLVVDDALRAITARDGTIADRQLLEAMTRCNECGNYGKTVELATELIHKTGGTPEVFHQRSLALFQMDAIEQAIADCHQTLELNQYHYAAMVGLGHCHLELGDLLESLFWFRQALDIFPDLEPVRLQIRKLEKAIQEL